MSDTDAYLLTCGLMFLAGLVIVGIGAILNRIFDADWCGLVIGIGLVCMAVGPLMLIGAPS